MEPREFEILKAYFDKRDMAFIERKGISVFSTTYGIYGSSDLRDVYALFQRIGLSRFRSFVDLGSGAGRVALLAALFTASVGIEGDEELHALALEAKEALAQELPSLGRCELKNADYVQEELSGYDILFIYADHNWPESFQDKLLRECRGTALSLHNIFSPGKLKKGKTYWIGQTPFVSYPLNVESSLDDG